MTMLQHQVLSELSVRIQILFLSEQRAGQRSEEEYSFKSCCQMHLPTVLWHPLERLTPQQFLLKYRVGLFFHLSSVKYSRHLLSSKSIAGIQQMIIPSMFCPISITSSQTIKQMLQDKDSSEGWEVGAALTLLHSACHGLIPAAN